MKSLIHSLLSRFVPKITQAAPLGRQEPRYALVEDEADPIKRGPNDWPTSDIIIPPWDKLILPTAHAFPLHDGPSEPVATGDSVAVGDSAVVTGGGKRMVAMDAGAGDLNVASVGFMGMQSSYAVPQVLQEWYLKQSFIGYQACAIIAQNWLVDKACTMPAQDAIRNGWEVDTVEGDLDDEQLDLLKTADEQMKIKQQCVEFVRKTNHFGIRIALFHVESDDPLYYEKPFNEDGVTNGSYKGIKQIDPYWMMPMLTMESTGDPTNLHFYDPEYWIISGRKYHRSHLIIGRGPEPADIFKPTYIYGGIPLVQRIYERVYAAERTANEAPLLAMNKRTTAMHFDLKKVSLNEAGFIQRLKEWALYRDNHSVKVLGLDETMEEFDTSLSDLDKVIMNQYQIVAAISKVPATKLLGTQPTGFNSSGDYEEVSYHEELESVQEIFQAPLINRHHQLVLLSNGIRDAKTKVVFNPVESMTAEKLANLNKMKLETAQIAINLGALSPDEERTRLRSDPRSGYNHLSDEEAETEFGMSTENQLEQEKTEAQTEKAEAAQRTAQAKQVQAGVPGAVNQPTPEEHDSDLPSENAASYGGKPGNTVEPSISDKDALTVAILQKLLDKVDSLAHAQVTEGVDVQPYTNAALNRSVTSSVSGRVYPGVLGAGSIAPAMPALKLLKMKLHGLPIVIENPRGTMRSGMDMDGNKWESKMPAHYGYIRGVTGADGDGLDCFVGPNMQADKVFVINQTDPQSGEFDEHKCMMGFDDAETAKQCYHDAYSDDWQGFDSITEMSVDQFKNWIAQGHLLTPLQASQIQNTQTPNEERQ